MKSRMWTGLVVSVSVMMGCGQYVKYDGESGNNGSNTATSSTASTAVKMTAGVGGTSAGGETTATGGTTAPGVEVMSHKGFGELVTVFASREATRPYVVVDYVAWSKDAGAMERLEAYLGVLGKTDPGGLRGKAQQQAYWYNAYNASVIKGVLRDFGGNPAGFTVLDSGTFFSDRVYTFGGVGLSLDQIENGVLRGDFESEKVKGGASVGELDAIKAWHRGVWGGGGLDARFHAALNCGALGCPNLLLESPGAYEADQLEAQLGAVTEQWLASVEKGAGPAGVSKLFEWYEGDFRADKGSVEEFVGGYRVGGKDGVKFGTYIEYDWTLNSP